MLTWIDILIVGILLVCMLWGSFKGFIKSVFSIITIICSFIAAKIFTPFISDWLISNTRIEDTIHSFLRVNEVLPDIPEGVSIGANNIKEWFASINLGEVPNSIINFFSNLWNNGTSSSINAGSAVQDALTSSIISFISFMGILIFAYVVISLLVEILNLISKLPVIGTFNRLGGALVGIIKGIILNLIIISILFVVAIFLKDSSLNTALGNSMFASYFYIGYILL